MNHFVYRSRKLKTELRNPQSQCATYTEPSRALKDICIYSIYDNDVKNEALGGQSALWRI